MNTIYFFGGNSPFSNFHAVPGGFLHGGERFATSEAAFMYEKALCFGDEATARKIVQNSANPKTVKALGRSVAPFDAAQWDGVRYQMMVNVLWNKFHVPSMKAALLVTGDAVLAEASPYDRAWGIGISAADAQAGRPWRGRNLLGHALMVVRENLT